MPNSHVSSGGANTLARVLQFPSRRSRPVSGLARAAAARWSGCNAPVLEIATDLLEKSETELREKVSEVVAAGAANLIEETDRVMADAISDVDVIREALVSARGRLLEALAGVEAAASC